MTFDVAFEKLARPKFRRRRRSRAQAPAKIPLGVELSAERQQKTVNLIMEWIVRQL